MHFGSIYFTSLVNLFYKELIVKFYFTSLGNLFSKEFIVKLRYGHWSLNANH